MSDGIQAPKERKPKRPAVNASPRPPKAKAAKQGDDGNAQGKKKPRKKKDKNAPKGALSAYMYFGNANREQVKDHCLKLAEADVA